jgi:hypothetical protein
VVEVDNPYPIAFIRSYRSSRFVEWMTTGYVWVELPAILPERVPGQKELQQLAQPLGIAHAARRRRRSVCRRGRSMFHVRGAEIQRLSLLPGPATTGSSLWRTEAGLSEAAVPTGQDQVNRYALVFDNMSAHVCHRAAHWHRNRVTEIVDEQEHAADVCPATCHVVDIQPSRSFS